MKPVARMERCAIREAAATLAPDYAALHPGYDASSLNS